MIFIIENPPGLTESVNNGKGLGKILGFPESLWEQNQEGSLVLIIRHRGDTTCSSYHPLTSDSNHHAPSV